MLKSILTFKCKEAIFDEKKVNDEDFISEKDISSEEAKQILLQHSDYTDEELESSFSDIKESLSAIIIDLFSLNKTLDNGANLIILVPETHNVH